LEVATFGARAGEPKCDADACFRGHVDAIDALPQIAQDAHQGVLAASSNTKPQHNNFAGRRKSERPSCGSPGWQEGAHHVPEGGEGTVLEINEL
jgi:hypothetical protein